jgi:hypothetical protein
MIVLALTSPLAIGQVRKTEENGVEVISNGLSPIGIDAGLANPVITQ